MKSLFPEMEAELALDRLAASRETRQRARDYLRPRPGFERWVEQHLTKNGPQVDANIIFEACDQFEIKPAMTMFMVMGAMWRVGKLWREPFPNHPSGEKCYLYGIKGVHAKPQKKVKKELATGTAFP